MHARGAKTRGVEVRRLQRFEENTLADVLAVRMVRKIKDAGRVSRFQLLRGLTLSKMCLEGNRQRFRRCNRKEEERKKINNLSVFENYVAFLTVGCLQGL